jgi:hypothetical protein
VLGGDVVLTGREFGLLQLPGLPLPIRTHAPAPSFRRSDPPPKPLHREERKGNGDCRRGRILVEERIGACSVPRGPRWCARVSQEEIWSSRAVGLSAIARRSNPSAVDRRSPWVGRSAHPSRYGALYRVR